jgi:hypothetical protein
MQLTADQQEKLEIFCEENDIGFRKGYSGRGMYGKECIGFVYSGNAFSIGLKMAQEFADDREMREVLGEMDSVSQDNMGRDMIIYFPYLQAAGSEEETEDDEDEE